MPGIRRVIFSTHFPNSIVQELCGQLTVLYSDRLKSLLSYHPITVPPDHTFRQLKSISTWYSGSIGYQSPRVDPTTIVSLDLRFWPTNHSWAPFSTDDGSMVIEFPSLKRLSAVYRSIDTAGGVEMRHRDGHPWKLHFPRLDRLDVECQKDACPLFDYVVLPPCMDKVVIEATAPVLVRVAEMRLPTARRLEVVVGFNCSGNPAALAAANRILEGAPGSKEMALEVRDESLPVLPESITCTSLTKLSIRSNTGVDTMLELIRKLPSLDRLVILNLTLEGAAQEGISIPEPDGNCLVEPLSTKLTSISIASVAIGRPAPEMLVSVAKCLLLRIPTLTRFYSLGTPRRPIAEFVNAHFKRYPHLAGIEYLLSKNKD